ncbi:AAA family ATPase [Candidatus Woesearchaeota archaeon]|nr:AAA family ATPase [Candidatus Woesearchaeota archaeon]
MIMALTGKNASGKGEVANYLKTKGFVYYSLSDVIREEATKRGLEHSRDNLIKLGNELRKKYEANYLAKQINNKIKNQLKKNKNLNFVIDSVRSPFEAKELMKNKDFALVGIDAPIELRFKRLLERNRLGDAKTLEEFKEQEERENLKSDTNQQLDETFKMSQKVIVNDKALNDLHKKIDNLINKPIND